jgi:hypothetical protein
MPLPLLEVLLRDRIAGPRIFSGLSAADCLSLRLANHRLQAYVNAAEGCRLFGVLRVKEGGVSEKMRRGLVVIGKYCGEVVVEVGPGKLVGIEEREKEKLPRRFLSRPSTSKRVSTPAKPPPTTSPGHWVRLFSNLPNLHTLVISSTQNNASWTPTPYLDNTIIALRNAFETANLPHVHTLRLHPIHPLGLLHLRWTIAFGDAGWIAGKLWSQIKTLIMHVFNPGRQEMTPDQQVMFAKILHSYIAGFAGTLVRLVFVWIGEMGVCPLLFEVMGQKGIFSAPGLKLKAVRSLWLGNMCLDVEQLKAIMMERMMECEEVWVDGVMKGPEGGFLECATVERMRFGRRWVWKYGRLAGEEAGRVYGGREEEGESEDDADSETEYNGVINHYNQMGADPTDIERFERLRNG